MFGAPVANDFLRSAIRFYDRVPFLKCLSDALPRFPRRWKDGRVNMSEQVLNSGQRSTPFTRADSRVMVNSLSVCRMRERPCTEARSRSRAPSSYVLAVRGNSARRGSHWERSRSLPGGTGQWSELLV